MQATGEPKDVMLMEGPAPQQRKPTDPALIAVDSGAPSRKGPDPAPAGSAPPAPGARRPSVGRRVWGALRYRVAGLLLLLLVWQLVEWWVGNPRAIPGPWPVAVEIYDILAEGDFFAEAAATVRRVTIGFLIAYLVAIVVGLAMGMSRTLENLFDLYVLLGLAIPGLAYAVIALVLFGLNERAAIIGVAATTIPILILNVWQGTKSIDKDLLEMAAAFELSRVEIVRHIRVPALTPFLLAALRLGLALAWKLVVIAEMLGLGNGIGYQISFAFSAFSMRGVLAWTLTFTLVLALLEFGLIRPIEKWVLRWKPQVENGSAQLGMGV